VQVLRLQPGDGITLFHGGADGPGGEFEATVLRMGRSDVRVQVGAHHPIEREAPRAIHLLAGITANERMDWLVEKATELGVASITPLVAERSVLKLKVDDMRAAGLSARKIDYLVDLALHFDNGKLHVKDWESMDDEAIIAELVDIRGIGRWTAEMFLIFYLQRPNVLPLDDPGLITGISQNYFSGEQVSRSDAREVAEAWKPWCSVATWYIWRSLDPAPTAD
jgi:hypothetical protein